MKALIYLNTNAPMYTYIYFYIHAHMHTHRENTTVEHNSGIKLLNVN